MNPLGWRRLSLRWNDEQDSILQDGVTIFVLLLPHHCQFTRESWLRISASPLDPLSPPVSIHWFVNFYQRRVIFLLFYSYLLDLNVFKTTTVLSPSQDQISMKPLLVLTWEHHYSRLLNSITAVLSTPASPNQK